MRGDHPTWRVVLLILAGAIFIGTAISRLAGESAELIGWDVAQVAIAAVLTRVLVRRLAQRREAAAEH